MGISDYIDFSDEVSEAIKGGKPVVAIESAGTFEAFPYPTNEELSFIVENRIREAGACPAYIAVIGGRIKVGLSCEDRLYLSKPTETFIKASRRDIPILITKKLDALTAVASTMMIAAAVGIKVVTGGGIGGVHRGAEKSFDISADLEEFVKSNVIVVCSGAKSILDLKLTMEYLETHAVTMAGYKTRELPAYMAVHSGIKLDYSFESPNEVAECYRVKNALGNTSGILVANPVEEEYAVDSEAMNAAIDKAVKKAEEDNIQGKIITKFIMDIVKHEMGEDSVDASFHMNSDNAYLAASVAVSLSENS